MRGKSIRNKSIKKWKSKTFSLVNHKAYQFYKSVSKLNNRKDVKDFVEHGKLLSLFYKKIGEKIATSKGGIFIEGLGYFGMLMYPEVGKPYTAFNGKEIETKLNFKTDGLIYTIVFVPISKDNELLEWTMDKAFTEAVRKRVSEEIIGGMRYTFNPTLFLDKLKKKTVKK